MFHSAFSSFDFVSAKRVSTSLLLATTVIGVNITDAKAVSLREALVSAYENNPTIEAERARLRAIDEDVPRARSGFMPNVSGTLEVGHQHSKSRPASGNGSSSPHGYGVGLSQPIFSGFQTVNTLRAAEATVRAGRAALRAVEQEVLLDAVGAYADVLRDIKIVALRDRNRRVLGRQLAATRQRLALQEVTQTDLSQVIARHATAKATLELAKSNLRSSRATYQRVVGHSAYKLRQIRPYSKMLPKSSRQAAEISMVEHPRVGQAIYLEQAAKHNVDTIRGELLPSASLDANYAKNMEPSNAVNQTGGASVRLSVRIPFFQGGDVTARVRQAKHTEYGRRQEILRAKQEARERALTAYSQFVASRAAVQAGLRAASASRSALSGVREEEKVGQRTILDVLNAELELLNAQVQLTIDQRNEIVASYTLLASLGRLSVSLLNLTNVIYDPELHYQEVRHKKLSTRILSPDFWRASVVYEQRK